MAKTYAKLRGLMVQNDDQQKDLARLLLLSTQAVCDRINNRSEWRLGEMYAIMDHYRVPYSELHEVFPPNGKKAS